MSDNKLTPEIMIVLNKMCEFAGEEAKPEEFYDDPDWFRKCRWTTAQQEEFRTWFEKHLFKSAKARNTIMVIKSKNKMLIKNTVSFFIFNYGWMIREEY